MGRRQIFVESSISLLYTYAESRTRHLVRRAQPQKRLEEVVGRDRSLWVCMLITASGVVQRVSIKARLSARFHTSTKSRVGKNGARD